MTIRREYNPQCDECGLVFHISGMTPIDARKKVARWDWKLIDGRDLCDKCGKKHDKREKAKQQVEAFNKRFTVGEIVRHWPDGRKHACLEVKLLKAAYVTEDGNARAQVDGRYGFHARLGNIAKVKK